MTSRKGYAVYQVENCSAKIPKMGFTKKSAVMTDNLGVMEILLGIYLRHFCRGKVPIRPRNVLAQYPER